MIAGDAAPTLAQLLGEPDRDAGETTDQMTEDLLRMFGLSPSDAKKTAHRPLPDLTDLVRAARAEAPGSRPPAPAGTARIPPRGGSDTAPCQNGGEPRHPASSHKEKVP
jgi:hypothetical protein